MSAPSLTVGQTDFCDAVSCVSITSEPTSGYNTPIPRARISDLISCKKCHNSIKHYVEETSRAFRKMMYEHRVSAQKDGQINPVSRHFKSDGQSHKDMKFSVLEWCTPKFEASNAARRRRLELSYMFKLHCLAPIGINQSS